MQSMASIVTLFLASLALLCLLQGGPAAAQCSLSSVSVDQSPTGATVNGKPEYEVVVSNGCICSQSTLLLSCRGFRSAEPVDPNVFRRVDGETCVVNNELPVFQDSPVKFRYVWETKFDLSPVSSQVNCS